MSSFTTLWAEPGKKLLWLRRTIAIALVCSICLSWKLWVSSRLFPLSPVTDALPPIPSPLDTILLIAMLGLLAAIFMVARPRWLLLGFLALAALLSLGDQTRWQPWFYQYLFLLAAIALYEWNAPKTRNPDSALNASRLIVAFTYLWSGLQKLNANFVKETWPDMAGPLLRLLPQVLGKLPPSLILIIPLLEIATGLGLMTRKYRKPSVVLAVATQVVALLLLISSRDNTVVWPWNLAMILFVLILFWQDEDTAPRRILFTNNGFHAVVLLLFAVLPALSLLDFWDSYLSAALYSGNTDQAVIYVTPQVVDRLPQAIRAHIWQRSQPFFLDINRWSYGELNVPLYPEPRIYRRIARQICEEGRNDSDIKLRIKLKPNPITGVRESEFYDCEHLK